ncbi:hypothetical protein ABZ707_11310 [Streptomyces sp. NPDC006923]|uniref:hypothetical protein n=1 Tax=Streptomyces sp. NPDC006923 TaxID=3155355 RepID=UPI0033F09E2F
MHTTVVSFTLHRGKERPKGEPEYHVWQGTSQEFGEIRVRYPVPPHMPQARMADVRGGFLPTATFESRGVHMDELTKPTLNGATLRVGDAVVYMKRNRWAVTNRGRALHLKYLGDRYRLRAINRKDYTLTREPDAQDPGVVVIVKQSGIGRRRQLSVSVQGRALPADIALATLFAGVDRSVLTRRGAVRAGLARVFHVAAESAAT